MIKFVSAISAYTSSKVPSLGLEYLRLYREVKFQEGLYQLYLKMVELARLDMVKDVATVQLVDRALPPEKRSNKRLPLTLTTGNTIFILSFYVIIRGSLGKIHRSENEMLRWRQLLDYIHQWRQDADACFSGENNRVSIHSKGTGQISFQNLHLNHLDMDLKLRGMLLALCHCASAELK